MSIMSIISQYKYTISSNIIIIISENKENRKSISKNEKKKKYQ